MGMNLQPLHYFIYDTFKAFRMNQESWQVQSLDIYKDIRRIAAIYNANAQEQNISLENLEQAENKNTAATYLYQVDCDGEWGEIRFDFENKKIKIQQQTSLPFIKKEAQQRVSFYHMMFRQIIIWLITLWKLSFVRISFVRRCYSEQQSDSVRRWCR